MRILRLVLIIALIGAGTVYVLPDARHIMLTYVRVFFPQLFGEPSGLSVSIQTHELQMGNHSPQIDVVGTIEPAIFANVGTSVSGKLETLLVEVGDTVKKGQLLGQIDTTISQNDLINAETELANQQIQASLLELRIEEAIESLAEKKVLFQNGSLPALDVHKAERNVQQLELERTLLKNQIGAARSDVEKRRHLLENSQISAPIEGIVSEIQIHPGEIVNSSSSIPIILRIISLDQMQAKIDIPLADAPLFQLGTPLRFDTLDVEQPRYEATLKLIEPIPTEINNIFYLTGRFTFNNDDNFTFRPKIRIRAILTQDEIMGLIIPVSHLYFETAPQGGKTNYFVYTQDSNDMIQRVPIKIVSRMRGEILGRSDQLKAGQVILADINNEYLD